MARRTKESAAPEPGPQRGAPEENTGQLDFETSMHRLEEIVQELESGQVPLERAMQLFAAGLHLGGTCRRQLDDAQARVDKLLERPDGGAEIQPFEPAP
jgi:exodeoxyribonuclease VII small subunit